MTDIVCISDTHTYHDRIEVPDGDILVHAGDFCGQGSIPEVSHFLDWMEKQPHETKIVVPGNHDICVEEESEVRKEFERSGIELLIDSDHMDVRSGLTFYGLPWTPDFYPDVWGFQHRDAPYPPERLWDEVPPFVDIIVTHGPPYGFADQIIPHVNQHLGCPVQAQRVLEMRSTLKGVICGHIHGGYGEQDMAGVKLINASICTEGYQPTNPPIVWSI